MQLLHTSTLLRMTRNELLGLYRSTFAALAVLPEGSIERHTAELNLTSIRYALIRRKRYDFTPG